MAARKPPDREHPYGHSGYEVLSAIVSSIIMAFIAASIATIAVSGLGKVHYVERQGILYSAVSTVMIVLSVLALRKAAEKYQSLALRAEVRHLNVDIVESVIVLCGIVFAVELNPIYDIFTAFIVLGLMVRGIIENVSESTSSITQRMPSHSLERSIIDIAKKDPRVIDCHKIRMREIGDRIFVDMHLKVRGSISVQEAHDIAHDLEEEIKRSLRNIQDIVIHIEPHQG